MVTSNFTFLSNDTKTAVHAVKWTPDSGEYKAILQISHGMVEFIERYIPFAEFLTEKGYMVVGHDHKYQLRASRVASPDIRAGIALLIAAMSANGTSVISNIDQIDRGYQDIDDRLNALGAKITRQQL